MSKYRRILIWLLCQGPSTRGTQTQGWESEKSSFIYSDATSHPHVHSRAKDSSVLSDSESSKRNLSTGKNSLIPSSQVSGSLKATSWAAVTMQQSSKGSRTASLWSGPNEVISGRCGIINRCVETRRGGDQGHVLSMQQNRHTCKRKQRYTNILVNVGGETNRTWQVHTAKTERPWHTVTFKKQCIYFLYLSLFFNLFSSICCICFWSKCQLWARELHWDFLMPRQTVACRDACQVL